MKKTIASIIGASIMASALAIPNCFAQPLYLNEISQFLVCGNYYAFDIMGDYAYIATGYGVKVMDISDPTDPQEIIHFPTEGISLNLLIEGNYLFVCDLLGGIVAYNISNILEPQFMDAINTPGQARSIVSYQDYLYVSSENYGVQIIDCGNPNNLELVDILYTGGEASYLAIMDHWLYVTLGVAGLGVYDITNPEDPQFEMNWNTILGNAKGLYIFPDGDTLAMSDFDNGTHLLSLTFPWIPTWVATIVTPGEKSIDVTGQNYYGILSHRWTEIKSFNTSGVVLDSLEIEDCTSVKAHEGYCYVCKGTYGFDVVSCSTPTALNLVITVPDSGKPFKAASIGNILYVGGFEGGLSVIDYSDPENPELLESISTGYWTMDVFVTPDSGYLYAGEYTEGIKVFDISDPADPQLVTTVSQAPDSGVHAFEYYDGYLYVASFDGVLKVYDISNPALPVQVTSVETFPSFRELAITEDGSHLYGCAEYDGVVIFRINAPDDIVVEDTLDFFYQPRDIAINGNYAYVADKEEGLYVLNITNSAYVFKVDSLPAQSLIIGVEIVNDNVLAICDWDEGVALVDISDPLNVELMDQVQNPGYANQTYYDGQYLFMMDSYDVTLYELTTNGVGNPGDSFIPSNHVIFSNAYPNPFNANTKISFEIFSSYKVDLSIYNIYGEKVRVLVDEYLSPGAYSGNFSADDLASGIYFARLKCDENILTQKITLIK